MPRVLIAGCGYVGAAVGDVLARTGWSVEGWTHSSASAVALSGKPYPVRAVDISDAKQVGGYSAGEFDVIFHCASTRGGDVRAYCRVYLNGVQNLLARFGEATVVFTSSTSVYVQNNGEWVTEESLAAPETETGKILRETERSILERRGTVMRVAGIYGPARCGMLKKLLSGEAILYPGEDRFINQVHRDDVVGALLFLIGKRAPSEIYNVVDDRPVRESEFYEWLAQRLDLGLPGFTQAPRRSNRGKSNKRVSNRKLRGAGWTVKYPSFIEGLNGSVLPSFGL